MRTKGLPAAAFVLTAFCQCAAAQVSADDPRYFPFWIDPFDTSATFTDMSILNPAPAGADGRAVIHDGHFYDANGNRLRLLGSNLTFEGAFPDKHEAESLAAHMRKLGMNVIRFHHIDTSTAPRGLWLPEQSGFDPEQLGRLDWLIYQLKQHGIYTNLNLHVSRTYPGTPEGTPRAFHYGKGVDNFYPDFIQMQREYARALLTHENPYTKTTYAKEPAVLVVELNNENALTGYNAATLRTLPEPFLGDLTRQWQEWLAAKYANTEALRAKWDEAREPLGENMLRNANFANGSQGWVNEQNNGAKMEIEAVTESGRQALRVDTLSQGRESWNLQLHQVSLDLEEGAPYTLGFAAKADSPCTLDTGVRLDQAPWSNCGLSVRPELTTEWQDYSYTFKARGVVPDHCRVSFNFQNRIGTFWFADVSLKRGGLIGLPEGQALEDGTVALPTDNAGDAAREDFLGFLQDTEEAYVRGMIAFLKDDLGVEAFVCDTQASYGGVFGMRREALLSDFVDMHSYWQHPHFPGTPWDGANWTIGNTSMVASESGGTLPRLAGFRNADLPYTISEYDHPAPNDHAVELFPMFASFAAFQNWDGIYQFNYLSRGIDPDVEHRLTGYFELWSHPGKLAFLPVAAVMFRMNGVAADADPRVFNISQNNLPHLVATGSKATGHPEDWGALGLTEAIAYRLVDGDPTALDLPELTPPYASNTGEIRWLPTDPEGAVYKVNAPSVRAAVGFIGGRDITLGDVTIRITEAENDWACVAVAALDGKPIVESARVLVVAAGRTENTNMEWNDTRTSVSNRWGTAPVLAEGIAGTVTLPGTVKLTALDETGAPKQDIDAAPASGSIELTIGPQFKTLWYGATR